MLKYKIPQIVTLTHQRFTLIPYIRNQKDKREQFGNKCYICAITKSFKKRAKYLIYKYLTLFLVPRPEEETTDKNRSFFKSNAEKTPLSTNASTPSKTSFKFEILG